MCVHVSIYSTCVLSCVHVCVSFPSSGQPKEKRKVTANKTRSGRLSGGALGGGVTRRSIQTGRGVKILPSLTENQVSKPSDPRRVSRLSVTDSRGLPSATGGAPSGRPQRQSLPGLLNKVSNDQQQSQAVLSTSLPVDLRGGSRGSVTVDRDEMARIKKLLRGLSRLYCHEVSRVYGDRLTDSRDKIWLVKLIEMCCKYCFCGVEIEDSSLAPQGGGGVVRRARPGRPSRGGGLPGNDGSIGPVAMPTMKLQSTTLKNDGLSYESMVELLPKHKQIELLKYDELVIKGEDLSALMFAKLPTQGQATSQSKTAAPVEYVEIGDGQVKEAINAVMDIEEKLDKPSDLSHVIMSREGMEHVIRLSRALVRSCTLHNVP